MSSTDLIEKELRNLGYDTNIFTTANYNAVVTFEYNVDIGPYKGNSYRIGISFQETEYPEYPPHFLHICNAPTIQSLSHSGYQENGQEWSAFSVPPSDFWDSLPRESKNMKTYLNRHVRRFWNNA